MKGKIAVNVHWRGADFWLKIWK